MTVEPKIYQFRISLKQSSPVIWRRILIRSDHTLADLYYAIQIVMGWTDYHLNEFIIHGEHYTIPNQIGMISGGGIYARDISLKSLKLRLNRNFQYQYDFTTGWEFQICFEKRLPIDIKKTYPTCISGSGKSPDEECGGINRFNELKDRNFFKSYEVMTKTILALADSANAKKKMKEVVNKSELKEALYWLSIDKYERRQVNKYLKYYANNDKRWQEAFDEVIYLG